MANRRLTLRITHATDVPLAVAKLEQALLEQGVENPSLTELLLETAERFQSQLTAPATITSDGAAPKQSVANTQINGAGYSIRITTQETSAATRLVDRLLGRPAAF